MRCTRLTRVIIGNLLWVLQLVHLAALCVGVQLYGSHVAIARASKSICGCYSLARRYSSSSGSDIDTGVVFPLLDMALQVCV